MKTIFENNGGTYTQVGDYLLPNLSLPAEEKETNIGVWAMRHKRYLKQNHKVRYYNLLTSGKLDSYLASILWIQKMNNIRNRATEIVNSEMIYR